jgi:hypothetical protein
VTADGSAVAVPVTVNVFPVRLPPTGSGANLLTSFHVVPETYVKKTAELYRLPDNAARSAANLSLFTFLAAYRISPSSWGFGEPASTAGYVSNTTRWWLDSAGNMSGEASAGGGFSAMRVPISTNRTSAASVIAGMNPSQPETWCDYLGAIRGFWASHGWLDGLRLPYLYTYDEPGLEGMKLVARQAAAGHACFRGARMLVTANPSLANRFAWDNRNGDDVDIWAVLARRYYGEFTNPAAPVNRARDSLAVITAARNAGKMIWSSTYTAVAGSPGYAASEPLSDPRVFLLWNALEGIRGTLYADGFANYTGGNPFDAVANNGVGVLIYPGGSAPVPSARLEQIRDGIEDWALFNIVRARFGPARVRAILGGAGLFSADASGVRLACHLGCELKSATKYSWPLWSHDATTASRIEITRLGALRLASSG